MPTSDPVLLAMSGIGLLASLIGNDSATKSMQNIKTEPLRKYIFDFEMMVRSD